MLVHFTVFLINSCFSSSSINAKQKFTCVWFLLPSTTFYQLLYSFCHFSPTLWYLCFFKKMFEKKNLSPSFITHLVIIATFLRWYCRVPFNDPWFLFYDSSWSFQEPYFSRKHFPNHVDWTQLSTRLWS